jgi:hypothetical protein
LLRQRVEDFVSLERLQPPGFVGRKWRTWIFQAGPVLVFHHRFSLLLPSIRFAYREQPHARLLERSQPVAVDHAK